MDGHPAPHSKRWATLGVMCLVLVLISIDNTILYVALPTLVEDLGPTASELQWIVDSYTLLFAVLLLVAGALGDRFGRRGALVAGMAVFAAGSILAAWAPGPELLIAGRAVMGVGGAAIMPATLSIITNVFTDRAERARAIGTWAAFSGLGVAIGPLAGGWLLEHFWWGSVFLVNVPILAVGLVAVPLLVPTSRNPAAPPVDVPGALLSVAGLSALVWAIIEAPDNGWDSAPILAGFGVAVVLLAGFALWERRASHPMLDLRFFRDARFCAGGGAIALMFFAMFGALYLLTQHLQFVLGYDAFETGLRVVPVAAALAVAAPVSILLTRWFGVKLVMTAGLALLAGAFGLLTRLDADAGYGPVAVAIVLVGVGIGLSMAPATDAIMAALPRAKAGVGSAINDMTRQVGGALGVAVLGSLMAEAYRGNIDESLHSGALQHVPLDAGSLHLIRDQLGNALAVAHLEADSGVASAITEAARSAFVGGLSSTVVLVAAAVSAAGAVVAGIWMPRRDAVLPDPEEINRLDLVAESVTVRE